MTLKVRFKYFAKWAIIVFVALFLFRMAYGYLVKNTRSQNDYSQNFFGDIDNLRKNYASEKMVMKEANVAQAAAQASNQKYEKTATVKSKTNEFEEDEKLVKMHTKALNAIIQYEQNLGQKGNRQIHLLIGVHPDLFDSFYHIVNQIGVIKATEITKVDKTNEYRQLNAQKASIENSLASLYELKNKGGAIGDFIILNDKILETEEKAQELGVELGNFNTENEFCTVKLSMYEGETEDQISFIHRVKVALEWTVQYFALISFIVLVVTGFIYLLLLVIDKIQIMNKSNDKI